MLNIIYFMVGGWRVKANGMVCSQMTAYGLRFRANALVFVTTLHKIHEFVTTVLATL
jgi:hypothetical protein